jgi:hypothetical protein
MFFEGGCEDVTNILRCSCPKRCDICYSFVCIERRIKERGDVTVVCDDQGRRGIVCEPDCRGERSEEGH